MNVKFFYTPINIKRMSYFSIIILLCLQRFSSGKNVMIIVADDMGWNDVSFTGGLELISPNLDALAYSGRILKQHYVQPLCTPSRAALLTGKYPIHTGMQHGVINKMEPWGLPLEFKIAPQFFKTFNYDTYAYGKWHLGFFKSLYTPTFRGFDYHKGSWLGHQDHFKHTVDNFFDYRNNMEINYNDTYNTYSSVVITKNVIKDLREISKNRKPFFMYVAFNEVHAPVQAPRKSYIKNKNIQPNDRRVFSGMLNMLDTAVGDIIYTLDELDMLRDTLIYFTSDNGAATNNYDNSVGSNYPLRGCKSNVYEGGTRVPSFWWDASLIDTSPYKGMTHITDILPAILDYASLPYNKTELDGISFFKHLYNTASDTTPKRDYILYNMDKKEKNNVGFRYKNHKFVNGTYKNEGHYGKPKGYTPPYDVERILLTNRLWTSVLPKYRTTMPTQMEIEENRNEVGVVCEHKKIDSCQNGCLFDIIADPCENEDISGNLPNVVNELKTMLLSKFPTVYEPQNQPSDSGANPEKFNNVWTNWMDYNTN